MQFMVHFFGKYHDSLWQRAQQPQSLGIKKKLRGILDQNQLHKHHSAWFKNGQSIQNPIHLTADGRRLEV